MDQPIYAHNKSLIESNTCQRIDNSDNLQNQRTGGTQFYQPYGSLFPTPSDSTRPPWPSHPISTQDNQLHNGSFNGFQQDLAFVQKTSTVASHGLSQGPPPNMLIPSSSLNVVPHAHHPDPVLLNSGFSRPYLPPQLASSTFSSAPPIAPQSQMNAPMYSASPSTSGFYRAPPSESRQTKGSYLGDLPTSPSQSTSDSPSGSHNASRSETPVTANLRYQDQLRNQSFASQSSQNILSSPSLYSASHALTATPTTLGSNFGPSQPTSFPPYLPLKAQQQPLQLPQPPEKIWQQIPPQQHQGPPQQHQGPPQQHQGPPQQHQGPLQQHQGPLQQHQGHPQQLLQHPGPSQQQLPHLPAPPQPWITSQSLAEQGPNQPLHQQVSWPMNQQSYPQTSPLQQGQPSQQGYVQQPWQQPQVPPNQQLSWQQQQFSQSQQHPTQNHLNAAHWETPGSFEGLGLNQQVMMCNLSQEKDLVPKDGFVMNEPKLNPALKATNCTSEIMCCTLNAIPKTPSLLQKSRLPLGVLMHPFKDLSQLPLVQSNVIVRCRSCRTYMNPFITFLDPARWKCNICDRVNDVPSNFSYNPATNSFGEPFKRPEFRNASMEYIASDEYLVRPPMPAVYLYLLDVSYNAIETGYLDLFCETLMAELDKIPGDGRKQIGFMAYNSSLYFFNLSEELSQLQMIIVPDLEDPYVPCPEGLLVSLQQGKDMVVDLLKKLPSMFKDNQETGSALGSALQFATKMMTPTGGRISVFQSILPTLGEGALKNREDSSERLAKNVGCLGPATDFYKKIALECSSHHVSIDLFMLNSQYCDIASLDGVSKFTGGCLHYFPNFHAATNEAERRRFKSILSRYLTRKIGFEAVMRLRCSKGLSILGYHGNSFVRSTDLLSLPNVNPDAGYAVQLGMDDELETNYVSFQTAILYTSSKAERRIRVHTLCIPVTSSQSEIEANANQMAIVGLLSKMAVDKSLNIGLGDSREAMVNAAIDIMKACTSSLTPNQRMPGQLIVPRSLRFIPLLVLALLKSTSFRIGVSTKIDDRVVAMEMFKNLPWKLLFLHLHPYLYPVHNLEEKVLSSCDGKNLIRPPVVSLSSTQVDKHGAYVMDAGSYIYFYLGPAISDLFCLNVFGVNSVSQVCEGELTLPELGSDISAYLRTFISQLNGDRPFFAPLMLIKEIGKMKNLFYQHLIEDKTESSFSYQEFLHHICKEIKQ